MISLLILQNAGHSIKYYDQLSDMADRVIKHLSRHLKLSPRRITTPMIPSIDALAALQIVARRQSAGSHG